MDPMDRQHRKAPGALQPRLSPEAPMVQQDQQHPFDQLRRQHRLVPGLLWLPELHSNPKVRWHLQDLADPQRRYFHLTR